MPRSRKDHFYINTVIYTAGKWPTPRFILEKTKRAENFSVDSNVRGTCLCLGGVSFCISSFSVDITTVFDFPRGI